MVFQGDFRKKMRQFSRRPFQLDIKLSELGASFNQSFDGLRV